MPGSTSSSRATPRITAAWLKAAPLGKVFAALTAGGAGVRVVGGAVRNTLLERAVTDIDLATTAQPADVMLLAKAAGLSVYPTGIGHGTVTVVADDVPYEVTTLRRDVETDGRRAVVAFTTDWSADAGRRDFTINALFSDADGTVFDPVGGLADLAARRVRFIGDAHRRIREDYLRILRFFRFTAEYADGAPDADGLAACTALKDGLASLSAERTGAEMMKLLSAARAGEMCAIMDGAGLLGLVLGGTTYPDRLMHLQAIEAALGVTAEALTRLAALALDDASDAAGLARRLRLAKADADALQSAATVNPGVDPAVPELEAKVAIYRLGPDAYRRAVLASWARSSDAATDPAWKSKYRLAELWRAPAMPFGGGDVLALGVAAGPRVGVILKAFEDWWIGQNFPADTAAQRGHLIALAKRD